MLFNINRLSGALTFNATSLPPVYSIPVKFFYSRMVSGVSKALDEDVQIESKQDRGHSKGRSWSGNQSVLDKVMHPLKR